MANSVIYVELDLLDDTRKFEVFFDFHRGEPGKFDGHPDDQYDAEPDEIYLSQLFIDDYEVTNLLKLDYVEDYIIECIKGRIDDE